MTKYINAKQLNYKSIGLIAVVFIAGLFHSCKEEKLNEIIIPTRIGFAQDSYTILREDNNELVVNLSLTRPLEANGTVTIAINANTTADNTAYTINPAPISGKITLSLLKGDSTASFTVKSNHIYDDEKVLGFTVESGTGAILPVKTGINTVVMLQGNVLVPELSSLVTNLPDFGELNKGEKSESKLYTLTASNLLQNVMVVAPANFEVSLDDVTFSNQVSIDFKIINTSPVTVYVKFTPNTGIDKSLSGNIVSTVGSLTNEVQVSGKEIGNVPPEVLILEEYFNYGNSSANLIGATGSSWKNISGTLNPLQYVTSSLSFKDYPTIASTGAVTMTNGSGSREDAVLAFPEQTTGIIYSAQLIKISQCSLTGVGDFFYSMRDGSGTYNRIYAAQDANGKLILSLGRNTSPTSSTTPYEFNKTYLIVTKYDFTTKISSMYVIEDNPTGHPIPATEPTVADVVTSGGTAPTKFNEVSIRQNTGVLDATIDGIRVGVTWKGVLGL